MTAYTQAAQQLGRFGPEDCHAQRLHVAQPPRTTLKKVHPSCLVVVCPFCPSLPAAGSTVILASAALPLPSCSWPRNGLLPPLVSGLAPHPAAEQSGQAPCRGHGGQSACLFSVLSAALSSRVPGVSHRRLTVRAALWNPG